MDDWGKRNPCDVLGPRRCFHAINDATGFAEGEVFDSAGQAREYFARFRDEFRSCFEGHLDGDGNLIDGEDLMPSQDTLNAWAEDVVEWGFHIRAGPEGA